MAVARRVRFEVLRRDGHRCKYCGATAAEAKLTVDHVVPQALGGTDEPANLVTACEPCNNGKASVPADASVVEAVADDAMRWAAALQQAAENSRAAHEERLAYRKAFRDAWNSWGSGQGVSRRPVPLADGWEHTLDNFRDAGLPVWELAEGITVAMTRDKIGQAAKFKYFCGICWTKVRKLQADAKALVGAGATVPVSEVTGYAEEERDGWPVPMTADEGGLFDAWASKRAAAGTPFTDDQAFNAAWQVSCLVRSGVSVEEVGAAISAAALWPWPVRLVEALGTGMDWWDAWHGFFFASARLLNATDADPWTADEQAMVALDVLQSALGYVSDAIDTMAHRADVGAVVRGNDLNELSGSFDRQFECITRCLPGDFPTSWREENYVENPLAIWGGWWNRRQSPDDY